MDDTERDLRNFVASVRTGTLPRTDWSHEAHLIICWAVVTQRGDIETSTEELSRLIDVYNRCSGLPPDRIACHRTITRYYVLAVAALAAPSFGDVLLHPWCSRRAVERHWSSELLAAPAARDGWVEPDREPLPLPLRELSRRPPSPSTWPSPSTLEE